MKTAKDILNFIRGNKEQQKYMCAYYLINGKVRFLHVVEMPTYKSNAYIAPFGVAGEFPSDAKLDKELSIFLKSNRAEKYEDRSPNERIGDIYNFDTTIFKTK